MKRALRWPLLVLIGVPAVTVCATLDIVIRALQGTRNWIGTSVHDDLSRLSQMLK